ncbi:sulfotransferase [Pseudomonadota bacterium]
MMLKIYFCVLRVIWRIYGVNKTFFQWMIGEPLIKGITFVTLFLDRLFFPGFRVVKVKNPVFIIGHPRSGTTFLHKLLSHSDKVVTFTLWQIMHPSLTARVLFSPIYKSLCKKGKTEVFPKETGHKMDLRETEEEEMLLFSTYDTQFIQAGLLGLDDKEYPELQWHDKQADKQRFKSVRFLRGCFQRQIYSTGKTQIVAQTHFSTLRIKTLMEEFPDAKFIYVIRDPHQVVPSFLSLLHKTFDLQWGIEPIPKDVLARYRRRRYQAMIDLYRYFYELQINKELPENKVIILSYQQLLDNLQGAVEGILEFTGMEKTPKMMEKVALQAERQSSYKPDHKGMSLEEFGITRKEIDKDFDFVFDYYGIKRWRDR